MVLLFFVSSLLFANIPDYGSISGVKYISNYDGDTIKVDIKDAHPLFGSEVSVRLYGIDTPEIKSKNKCERQKTVEAKEVVKNLLSNAEKVSLKEVRRDKYFRILAKVYADDVNVSDELIKKNLAYAYYGDTKKKINWCESDSVNK